MNKIRIATVLIVVLVIGISLTVSGISGVIKMNGEIPDFNYDSMQNIKKGDLVQGYVTYVLDSYASETTTNTSYGIETNSYTSEECFVLQLINEEDYEDDLYITLIATSKEDRDLLYELCDATWDYYEGNENVVFPEMGIVAKVAELDPEYEQFFVDWFMYDPPIYESEAEARRHIVPYALRIYNPNSAYTSLAIGLVIILIYVVIGIILYNKFKSAKASQTFAPVQETNAFAVESKPSENGFEEAYTAPQPVPIPDIPQPVQPDEFFAKAPKAAPVAEAPKEEPAAPPAEEPKQEATAPANGGLGSMDGLDTTGMFDDADYEVEEVSDENDFIE